VSDKDCVLIGSRNTLRECILSRRDELLSAFQGEEEEDDVMMMMML